MASLAVRLGRWFRLAVTEVAADIFAYNTVITGANEDGNFEQVGVLHGALNVHDADVHNILVNRHFIDFDSATENPSVAIVAGDTLILVASTAGFTADDDIVIRDGDGNIYEHHFNITDLVENTSITVDRPIDQSYTTSAVIELVAINMAVAGSLAAPVTYFIQPPSDQVWHILRIVLSITDDVVMDDAKFGGISALANGVVVRTNQANNTTLTNWKSNQHMIEDMYDITYSDKAPAGSYGLRARWTLKRVGVAIRLDGALGDKLEILVQDALEELDVFKCKAQGHIE